VPRYVLVDERDVAPDVRLMAESAVRWAAADLQLGAFPEIRWFADTRELPKSRVAAAAEVYVPGDGLPTAGNVPPYVRYRPGAGWELPGPVILLNRSQCLPDTPLHESRHLWQIKAGRYRADEDSTRELEDDADSWAAAAVERIGLEQRTARSDVAPAPGRE
jgi:hypothetical protein